MRDASTYRGARRNSFVAVRAGATRFDGWQYAAKPHKIRGVKPKPNRLKLIRELRREYKARAYYTAALAGGSSREVVRRLRQMGRSLLDVWAETTPGLTL